MTIPEAFLKTSPPSDGVFSALFWLRRGLAERDPLDTFSALMVCIQVLARELVDAQPVSRKCTTCGAKLDDGEPSITSMVRELLVNRLGAKPALFNKLWKARNAVVAHGNRSVTAEVFQELTELKFDAALLAYKGIKLAMGLPVEDVPTPDQAFS